MPKNIILCSDGTGNADIKGRGTNVFKLFEAVDLNEHRTNPALDAQLAFYDDGVGTRGNLLLKGIGGAAGYGLKRNVKELYRELSRVYDSGDRIFLFGFSRGAFTVRTLAGMIAACGVLNGESFETARKLRAAVEEVYDAYRAEYHSVLTRAVGRLGSWPTRDAAIAALARRYPLHLNVPIRFIGVWDTVDAVGMPFAMADFVNRVIYQFKFPTHKLSGQVAHACHALSIDDPRVAFEPVLWQGPDDRIEQVWFAGVHSNVGGGYPKQGLSLVALDWMLGKAERSGLRLQAIDREIFRSHASVDDMLYNPRSGIGLLYRWAPRDIRAYCRKSGIAPAIHLSVEERIAHATDDYAPGNIPPDATIAITPVDLQDPRLSGKERILGDRAAALERVMRQALDGRYLLDEVRTPIRFGNASYWVLVSAWFLLVLSVVSAGASVAFDDPLLRSLTAVTAVAAVAAALLVSAVSGYADDRMDDAFSSFWQKNQKKLRAALKKVRRDAREPAAS